MQDGDKSIQVVRLKRAEFYRAIGSETGEFSGVGAEASPPEYFCRHLASTRAGPEEHSALDVSGA